MRSRRSIRLQGVNINDKHIETIVRQMMRWIKVEEVGDTEFLLDEQVDKFRSTRERARGDCGRPACQGTAPVARHHEGFALYRQFHLGCLLPGNDTSPDRSRYKREGRLPARPEGKRYHGRLIPAGTGMEYYRNVRLTEQIVPEEPVVPEPDLEADLLSSTLNLLGDGLK